jgi:hypothetical protein
MQGDGAGYCGMYTDGVRRGGGEAMRAAALLFLFRVSREGGAPRWCCALFGKALPHCSGAWRGQGRAAVGGDPLRCGKLESLVLTSLLL